MLGPNVVECVISFIHTVPQICPTIHLDADGCCQINYLFTWLMNIPGSLEKCAFRFSVISTIGSPELLFYRLCPSFRLGVTTDQCWNL